MVELFKALSQENRIAILALLFDQQLCVCDVESNLNLTQSNASRHLMALKQAGIIESVKAAQWVYYKVKDSFISDNHLLWQYLVEQFAKPQFKVLRDNYKPTSLCSMPITFEKK
jgi:ArsR family transcriptional regulator, arsenate/arsenite/antimonite-responsive transcriptional repressor